MGEKTNRMGTMAITPLLLKMSGPAILSMMINALYNIVDSIFVARLGEDSLTAVTLGIPIQFLIVAIGVGTGIGINSFIARRLGEKNFKAASNAAGSGMQLAFFNWIIFLIFGLVFTRDFVSLFSNNKDIINQADSYLSIVTIFSFFALFELLIEKIFQGTGNMIYPMITMISGALINLILDPILIFGMFGMPKLGVTGAAISTVFSQFCSMVIGICLASKYKGAIRIKLFTKKINWNIIKDIYKVGLPSIIMQAIGSIMLFALNTILSGFSSTAVAILGVYGRLQMFIFMPCIGINQGALPIMAYNYGAKNKDRLMRTFKVSLLMSTAIMVFGLLIFQLKTDTLLDVFNANSSMREIGLVAFKRISLCFIPAGFGFISAAMLQATGHGLSSMWGAVIRQFLGIIPLAFIFGNIGGLNMVWFAFVSAEILGGIYYAIIIYLIYQKSYKHLTNNLSSNKTAMDGI